MAALVAEISLEYRDFDKCLACFRSINEALDHGDADEGIEFETFAGGVRYGSTSIVWTHFERCEGNHVLTFKPAPGMILFIGWLMNVLPSRARVTWLDGWPHVYCPPNDDRDIEAEPTPLVPNELMPA